MIAMTGLHSRHDLSGPHQAGGGGFPLPALIALALCGFVTILTEALPAGLLTQIGADLTVSTAAAGQMVTIYAIGSFLAAIPLVQATQGMRRRALLASALAGFAIANLITALSPFYALTMVARLAAGVSAGLLWALLAGYAARMVPDEQKGRAIAVAMAGTPLALSIGVPAATFLGTTIGWRACFAIMSVTAVLLTVWIWARLPDFPGQVPSQKTSFLAIAKRPTIRSILFVTLTFVLAHNILYTYIRPLLHPAEMSTVTDVVLLVFGCCAMAGIWIAGILIDRHIWALAVTNCITFIGAVLVWGLWPGNPAAIYLAVLLWGLSFGGAATIFQTAAARAAPRQTDVAQSLLVTVWNLAIAGGGIIGGVLLEHSGVASFSPAALALLMPCALVVFTNRQSAFRSHEAG